MVLLHRKFVKALSISSPCWSPLVHCSCELWLFPAGEPDFNPACCFQPFNQAEICLAMTFFKRVILCLLLLLCSDGEVKGDLRTISQIDSTCFFKSGCLRKPQVLSIVFILRQWIRSSPVQEENASTSYFSRITPSFNKSLLRLVGAENHSNFHCTTQGTSMS